MRDLPIENREHLHDYQDRFVRRIIALGHLEITTINCQAMLSNVTTTTRNTAVHYLPDK
jgi:hypothetical protein